MEIDDHTKMKFKILMAEAENWRLIADERISSQADHRLINEAIGQHANKIEEAKKLFDAYGGFQ